MYSIYVVNSGDETVTVIDGSTNKVIDTITLGGASGPPGIAVNSNTNCIYVPLPFDEKVEVIDGASNGIVETITFEDNISSSGINVNPTTNRIYIPGSGGVVFDGETHEIVNKLDLDQSTAIFGFGVNRKTNFVYAIISDSQEIKQVVVIRDDLDGTPLPTPTPSPIPSSTATPESTPTPSPTPDVEGKSFTFRCNKELQSSIGGTERLVLELCENEQCALKLTNFEPGVAVEISSQLKKGLRSAIKIDPAKSVTDANGELEITITPLHKGTVWADWAVKSDKGKFEFSKKAYDEGFAWGMFVVVE